MDIQEQAKAYAEGKVLEALSAAVEKAYMDGYEEGYRAAENSKVNEVIDGVEYVDLGLPSGTKWASGYLTDNNKGERIYLTYGEAEKLNIPTTEQFRELLNCCINTSLSYIRSGIVYGKQFLGSNGNFVEYYNAEMVFGDKMKPLGNIAFWLKENSQEGTVGESASYATSDNFLKEFVGTRFPVILVK